MFEDMFEKARAEMVKDNATKRELTKDTKINLKQVLDAGKPEGTVSHRKNGDFIKQGGEWKPYKDNKKENKITSNTKEKKPDYLHFLITRNEKLRELYLKEKDPEIKKAMKKALKIQFQNMPKEDF
jgi:hypothetical protein